MSTSRCTEAYAFHAEALAKVPGEFSDSVRSRLRDGRKDFARGLRAGARRSRADARRRRCGAVEVRRARAADDADTAAEDWRDDRRSIGGREEPLRPLTLRLTQLFNLTGHPAISLPCGDTREGLPCGFQIVGRRQQTAELLQVALSCEAFVSPRAPSSSPRP